MEKEPNEGEMKKKLLETTKIFFDFVTSRFGDDNKHVCELKDKGGIDC